MNSANAQNHNLIFENNQFLSKYSTQQFMNWYVPLKKTVNKTFCSVILQRSRWEDEYVTKWKIKCQTTDNMDKK